MRNVDKILVVYFLDLNYAVRLKLTFVLCDVDFATYAARGAELLRAEGITGCVFRHKYQKSKRGVFDSIFRVGVA